MGAITVATDWVVVVSPMAVPSTPRQESATSACMYGKTAEDREPLQSAAARAVGRLRAVKKTADVKTDPPEAV